MSLPDHRRAIHGRTWPTAYEHGDWAGIEHHPSPRSWLLSDCVIAALLVGVLAALLFGVL